MNDAWFFDEYIREEVKTDEYYDKLEAFWYKTRPIDRDWEDLTQREVEQVARDYAAMQEMKTSMNHYYGVAW